MWDSIIFDNSKCMQPFICLSTCSSYPNNKLCKISSKLHHFPLLHQSCCRKEQVILSILLIGHTHVTHFYLLNKEQSPNCDHCRSPLTVEHLLTPCSAYKNKYHHSQLSHILINISKQHIFNYLSNINILDKL